MPRPREGVSLGPVLAMELVSMVLAGGCVLASLGNPYLFWMTMVGCLTLAAFVGRRWYRASSSMLCGRCQYPLEAFMVRCPECGLGRDGSEPPAEQVVVKDRAEP